MLLMVKISGTVLVVIGAAVVFLALSGFAHAASNVGSSWGSSPYSGASSGFPSGNYNPAGPLGQCNTNVATWDPVANDCVYIGGANGYYNTQANKWNQQNPSTPANQNPYIKYNTFNSNGYTWVYNTPVQNTGYTFDNQYYRGNAVYATPYANGYGSTSGPSNMPSGFGGSRRTGYTAPASAGSGSGNWNWGTQVTSTSYDNSFNYNNVVDLNDTATTNNYAGYNGLYTSSPYYAPSTSLYYNPSYYSGSPYYNTYNNGYCYTCSGSYNYQFYAPYVSTALPSWYFYYWSS